MIQRRRDRVSRIKRIKGLSVVLCRLRLSNEIYKHRRSIFNFKKIQKFFLNGKRPTGMHTNNEFHINRFV